MPPLIKYSIGNLLRKGLKSHNSALKTPGLDPKAAGLLANRFWFWFYCTNILVQSSPKSAGLIQWGSMYFIVFFKFDFNNFIIWMVFLLYKLKVFCDSYITIYSAFSIINPSNMIENDDISEIEPEEIQLDHNYNK